MATAQDGEAGSGITFGIILAGLLAVIGAALLAMALQAPAHWVLLGALGLSALGYLAIGAATGSALITDHLVAGRRSRPS